MKRLAVVSLLLASLLAAAPGILNATEGNPPSVKSIRAMLDRRRYDHAERLARRLLLFLEWVQRSESVETAEALDLLAEARILGRKAREPETRDVCERAVRIWQRLVGPDDPRLGGSHLHLGTVFYLNAAYRDAAPHLEKAADIFERAGPTNRPALGKSLIYLAILRAETGEDLRSRAILDRALSILEAERSRPDDMALGYNALGGVLYRLADYGGSITAFERSISIAEKSRGADDPSVARALFNLGAVLYQIGDLHRSREVLERALRIRKDAFGPRSDVVGSTLMTLGAVYEDRADFSQARRCYQEALRIREETRGGNDERIAYSLLGLARIAAEHGDLASATTLAARAVTVREQAFGAGHWLVADAMARLGALQSEIGDSAAAAAVLQRTIEIQETSLGPDHPELGITLTIAASFHAKHGLFSRALDEALRAEAIGRENLRLATQSLPEHTALGYAGVRTSGLGVAMRVLRLGHDDPESRQRVWEALVRSRALVLDETVGKLRAAVASQDPEVGRVYAKLLDARRRLASLVVTGIGEQEDAPTYRSRLERARAEADQAERALAAAGAASMTARRMAGVSGKEISKALPDGTVLISYALRDSFYTAFVLSSGQNVPESIALGPQRAVDSLVSRWAARRERAASAGRAARSREELEYRAAGTALRKVVLDPILAKGTSARRLFIVPDGTLHLVSYYSLPCDDGGYLVEKDPVIHELSTERDLVLGESSPPSAGGMLLVGGARFDADPELSNKGRRGESSHASLSERTSRRARVDSDCEDIAKVRFEPLPGSLREIRDIASLWREVNSVERQPGIRGDRTVGSGKGLLDLTGLSATEGAFKRMAPGRKHLHIATHSFFLGGRCGNGVSRRGIGGVAFTESRPKMYLVDGPLLRSGLALTGANRRRPGSVGEDGMLTADEIAGLDLSSVEWAVLSGCETGGGDVLAGEGVLGLRRAFHIAGVRTLILSLWPVEDESARGWMRRFYEARWLRGRGIADAAKEASFEVLRNLRAQGRSTDPSSWAAFVASGDWN